MEQINEISSSRGKSEMTVEEQFSKEDSFDEAILKGDVPEFPNFAHSMSPSSSDDEDIPNDSIDAAMLHLGGQDESWGADCSGLRQSNTPPFSNPENLSSPPSPKIERIVTSSADFRIHDDPSELVDQKPLLDFGEEHSKLLTCLTKIKGFNIVGSYLNGIIGYVCNLHLVYEVISSIRNHTGQHFIKRRTQKKLFGTQEVPLNIARLSFMSKDGGNNHPPTIPPQTKPFYLHGEYISFECHHGIVHYTPKKRTKKNVKKRKTIFVSKKLGCLAKVVVKESTFFTGVGSQTKGSKRDKLNVLHRLKEILEKGNLNVMKEKRFYMRIDSKHTLHQLHCFQGISNPLDKEVAKEIQSLAEMGVKSAGVAAICLDVLKKVKDQDLLSQGLPLVISGIPDPKTIQNHLQIGLNKQKSCTDDQMNLMCLVLKWKKLHPRDLIVWRPSTYTAEEILNQIENEKTLRWENLREMFEIGVDEQFISRVCGSNILFLHMNEHQMRILSRYGGFVLIDAMYRTVPYQLALFLLMVKTNVGYSVVASFMLENEESNAISEVLSIIKQAVEDRGYDWNARYFMADKSWAEYNGIKKTFPDASVFICDFHREDAWLRWLTTKCNGVSHWRQELWTKMRELAKAPSEEYYDIAYSELTSHDGYYASPAFQHYLTEWHKLRQRWVHFWKPNVVRQCPTNNPIESSNRVFKQHYLQRKKRSSVSHVASVIVERLAPDHVLKYVRGNVKCLREKRVPSFMQTFPTPMAKKCLAKYQSAMREFTEGDVTITEDKVFFVKSSSSTSRYTVDYNSGTCTCADFTLKGEPCKHIFVPICLSKATWDDISPCLRSAPNMTIDHDILVHSNPEYAVPSADDCRFAPEDVGEDLLGCQMFSFDEKSGASYEVDEHIKSTSALGSFFYKRLVSKICEKVENIKSAAHASEDEQVLQETLQKLNEIYCVLDNSIPKRCGINRLKQSPVKLASSRKFPPHKVRRYIHFTKPLKKPYGRGRPKLKRKDLKKLVKETDIDVKKRMHEFRKGTEDEEDPDNVFLQKDSSSSDGTGYPDIKTPLKERLDRRRCTLSTKEEADFNLNEPVVGKNYFKAKIFGEDKRLVPEPEKDFSCTPEENQAANEAEAGCLIAEHDDVSTSDVQPEVVSKVETVPSPVSRVTPWTYAQAKASDPYCIDTPLAERLKRRLLIDSPSIEAELPESVEIDDDGQSTSDEIPEWRYPCSHYHSTRLKSFLDRKDFDDDVREEYLSIFHPDILNTIAVVNRLGWAKKVISPMVTRVTEKGTFDEIVKDYFLRSEGRHMAVTNTDFMFTCKSIEVMFDLEDKVKEEGLGVCLECPERYRTPGDAQKTLHEREKNKTKEKDKARLLNEDKSVGNDKAAPKKGHGRLSKDDKSKEKNKAAPKKGHGRLSKDDKSKEKNKAAPKKVKARLLNEDKLVGNKKGAPKKAHGRLSNHDKTKEKNKAAPQKCLLKEVEKKKSKGKNISAHKKAQESLSKEFLFKEEKKTSKNRKRGRLSLEKLKTKKCHIEHVRDPANMIDELDTTDPRVPVYMDNYYLVSTGFFILHDIDMRTLQGHIGMLTDRMIDAYMHLISQQSAIGLVLHATTQTLTGILQLGFKQPHYRSLEGVSQEVLGAPMYFTRGRKMLSDYTHIIGSVLEGGSHWTFVGINMKRKTVTYVDPMGNESPKKERLVKNWEAFTVQWNAKMAQIGVEGRIPDCGYECRTVPHPIQGAGDSVTCGIYTCMFACSYLTKVSIPAGPAPCSKLELKTFSKQMARDIINSRDIEELNNICHRCGGHIELGEVKFVLCCAGDCYPRRRIHVKSCSSSAERIRIPFKCNVCSVPWDATGALSQSPSDIVAMHARRTQQTSSH